MKIICSFLLIVLLGSCASGKDRIFTGSTPCGPDIKKFLGLAQGDSVDFVRWKLILGENNYSLHADYGIGKQNTNGFINGGFKIDLAGDWIKEGHYYRLRNGSQIIYLGEINSDLLHFAGSDKSLLAGTGGWAYTICIVNPQVTDQVNLIGHAIAIKDSMAFVGRTPCGIPGLISDVKPCIKLKWSIVFYADPGKLDAGTYKLKGTAWSQTNGIRGQWKLVRGKDGRVGYQLKDADGKPFLYCAEPDEHVLMFTDAEGKFLVGDGDFSYTLSRKF